MRSCTVACCAAGHDAVLKVSTFYGGGLMRRTSKALGMCVSRSILDVDFWGPPQRQADAGRWAARRTHTHATHWPSRLAAGDSDTRGAAAAPPRPSRRGSSR